MKFELSSLDQFPVVAPDHHDAGGIRFGFEGGTSHKVEGRYYVFTTEVFDEPKTAASRLACWVSDDGTAFSRHSTIAETNGDWADATYRMAPWSPMVVFDSQSDRWNLFHVAYRRKPNSDQPYNMSGRITRRESTTSGASGIAGPYVELEWVEFADAPDAWEGPAEIVSFYPFLTNQGWFAFYGSNEEPEFIDPQSQPQHALDDPTRFLVGLARADSIAGPWTRQSDTNPVLMDPDFIENPIVTRIRSDLYAVVYDGGNTNAISYALSVDGITWEDEKLIDLPAPPAWLNAMRTPLGLVHEDGDEFSIYFTAFDGVNPEGIEPLWHDGYGYIGRCRVRLTAGD